VVSSTISFKAPWYHLHRDFSIWSADRNVVRARWVCFFELNFCKSLRSLLRWRVAASPPTCLNFLFMFGDLFVKNQSQIRCKTVRWWFERKPVSPGNRRSRRKQKYIKP
jgi:hypothetical protein